MQEVAALCDTVVIIGHGRVVASGSGVELMSRTGRASLEDAFVSLLGSGEGLAA
jgi:ABC-type Na+ transport system, ATPase component